MLVWDTPTLSPFATLPFLPGTVGILRVVRRRRSSREEVVSITNAILQTPDAAHDAHLFRADCCILDRLRGFGAGLGANSSPHRFVTRRSWLPQSLDMKNEEKTIKYRN
eukprot:PhM_4_TR8217/c0_g2_i1/m.56820